jgi:hypothetical protein
MAFLDFFRPKWKNSDPAVRLEAVKLLADQDILAEIASSDEAEEVRALAALRAAKPKRLSFVTVVFDWTVKTWLDSNIHSQQEGFQFGVNAAHDIGGPELFALVEDLLKRDGAQALTMMGMRDWNESDIMEKIVQTFGKMRGISKSRLSLMKAGKGPLGGKVNVVFFVEG